VTLITTGIVTEIVIEIVIEIVERAERMPLRAMKIIVAGTVTLDHRAPPFVRVIKWKPNVWDGPSSTKEKSQE